MQVNGKSYRTIWLNADGWGIDILDQTLLPHRFETTTLRSVDDTVRAISEMKVRGAPLIGATAAYGLCLQCREDPSDDGLTDAASRLLASRPTAVNLAFAVSQMRSCLADVTVSERLQRAYAWAAVFCEDDISANRAIGATGVELLRTIHQRTQRPVNVLTHCNAGWLATVDWGTATAPIYAAQKQGIPIHVWVDETRPRNQGASLTAFELGQQGVEHTVIVDSAGGHVMQHGLVDICIVGSDRTTYTGDVCNKIGTYLKALAAADHKIPFYAAVPSSTLDFSIADGVKQIPIEQRSDDEVACIEGLTGAGEMTRVRLVPETTRVANYAFDVTPARLVTGLITEKGLVEPNARSITQMFPDRSVEVQ